MGNKKYLGVKSHKFILLEFIGFVASTFFSILIIFEYLRKSQAFCLLLGILFVVLMLVTGYLVIGTMIKPKYMVEYDHTGLYLNLRRKKTVFIAYHDIQKVFSDNSSGGHGHTYSFGILYIYTKTSQYKIGIINHVKDVETFIHSQIPYKSKS